MGTHTFAELEVSEGAYDEIAQKLKDAGYEHAFIGETIDMHGIGLTKGQPIPKGQISDGYHTFDELYDHRCLLFLAFQEAELRIREISGHDLGCWKSKKHADGSEWEGWFISGLILKIMQSELVITYHIPMKYWDLCEAPEQELAPEWDGHTSEDVIERLKAWLK